MITIIEDKKIRRDGDYETHEVISSDGSRMKYATNTRTGSVFKEVWYDREVMLQHGHLEMVLSSSGRRCEGAVGIDGLASETWARQLDVDYVEPEDAAARNAYRNDFRNKFGSCFVLTVLNFPWSDTGRIQRRPGSGDQAH
ncbi:hypothetical protein ACXYMO_16630 [Arenibacterium sp. CAU 1754]